MDKYVKLSIVEAEPTSWKEFASKNLEVPDYVDVDDEIGYAIIDGDNVYFQDKDSFEREQFLKLNSENKIAPSSVDSVVEQWSHSIVNDADGNPKTVIMIARLKNGFMITESSACVDPANFDLQIGLKCCMERIEDKIWGLLGFMLQSVQFLVKPVKDEVEESK